MAFNRYLLLVSALSACAMTPALAQCGQAVMRTHTPPGLLPGTSLSTAFPVKSRTVLRVKVNGIGYPDELTVVQSSGSKQLDKSAAVYVGQHWQWTPGCEKQTEVAVEWDLPLMQ